MKYVDVKIYSDGAVKGRAYTYKSDLNPNVGDLVIAEMGGGEKTLQVVGFADEATAQQKAVDGGFEYKEILRIASEEETQKTSSFELKTEEIQTAVISFNYDDIKKELQSAMAKYQGIIVTEDTLQGCKATQKDLAGLRRKIDTYRKEKKQEAEKPIKAFEAKCKDLIAEIDKVESPIKEGIAVFDERKKDEKATEALKIIDEVVADIGLEAKYANELTVIDKYRNLSQKASDTKQDVTARALLLKEKQDQEKERMEVFAQAIENENGRLTRKLTIDSFKTLIASGANTATVMREIKLQADTIYEAENPVEEPPAEEIKEEPVKSEPPVVEPISVPEQEEPVYKATYVFTGKLSSLQQISRLAESLGVIKEVVDTIKL